MEKKAAAEKRKRDEKDPKLHVTKM